MAAQIGSAPRFARMVSFFQGVGTPETAGYGTTGVPSEPAGFRDRQRKIRAAKVKSESAVGT